MRLILKYTRAAAPERKKKRTFRPPPLLIDIVMMPAAIFQLAQQIMAARLSPLQILASRTPSSYRCRRHDAVNYRHSRKAPQNASNIYLEIWLPISRRSRYRPAPRER